MLHRKTLKTQKTFFGFKSSISAILWGLVATLRRVLAIVGFFTPSLGLFNILYHWLAEQYTFSVRTKYHPLPTDNMQLFNQTESIRWFTYDRSRYEVPEDPSPPSYSAYTGFELKYYAFLFVILTIFHCLAMALVKYFTSEEFKTNGSTFNKLIHVIQNVNISFPYKDWDEGMFSIEEYRKRFRNTEREMFFSFLVNTAFSIVMIVPIWYTGKR